MDEHRLRERVEGMPHRKRRTSLLTASFVFLRLLLAFACGWVLSFLLAASNDHNAVFSALAFPPVLGFLAALAVPSRHPWLMLLSIATGLLAVAGIYAYWLPLALQQDARLDALCATSLHCHVGNGVYTALLHLFLLYGIVTASLGAGITAFLLKQDLKRETRHHLPEQPPDT